jgi:hypothetical protein
VAGRGCWTSTHRPGNPEEVTEPMTRVHVADGDQESRTDAETDLVLGIALALIIAGTGFLAGALWADRR